MKCALMIYFGKIKKLAGINENIELRNEEMKSLFQKLTLTFIAFEIKNEIKSPKEILQKSIDFMVRT